MALLALAFSGFTFYVCAALRTGSLHLESVLDGPVFFGVISAVIWLISSSRIRLRGEQLELVNPLFITRIRRRDIASIEHDNGLQVLTTSGRVYMSVAFGSSVLAVLTGNRRANKVHERLTQHWGPLEPDAEMVSSPQQSENKRPRPALWLFPVVGPVVALGFTLCLRALSH